MMRLRALRVAQVGRFDAPVSIEKLGDGLNVLSGPNELGKSTLLAALKALLLAKYDSKSTDVRALIPSAGGTPLIEADIEINGHPWRLRKQFVKGALALLTDLRTGAKFRNADAQARLDMLLASPLEHKQFGFLWVDQGGTLESIADDALGGGLVGLLEKELDAVILDAHARTTHNAIKAALEPLRTAKNGTPKAHGEWAKAIARLADAEKQLQAAEQRYTEQHGRLEQLSKHHAERAVLMDKAAVAERAEKVTRTRARLAEAQAALHQHKLAVGQLDVARAKLQAAEGAHKSLNDDLARLRTLHETERSHVHVLEAMLARRTEIEASKAAAEAALGSHSAAIVAFEKSMLAARSREAADEAARARDDLSERIAAARAADAERASADATIATLAKITSAGVAALRAAESSSAASDAAFAAVVPKVTIELHSGHAGAVRIDGQTITASAVLHPDTPLVLDIAGIGRVTIAPNPQTVSPEQRAARAALREQTNAQRTALGVASLAEAETRLSQRQSADAKGREAQARFMTLAPAGLESLLAQHAEAARRAASSAPIGQPVAAITAALEKERAAHTAAATTLRSIEQTMATIETELARLEASAAARMQQVGQLFGRLGDTANQDTLQQNAEIALSEARKAYTDAKSAADAWAAHVDAGRLENLAAELKASEQTQVSADQRCAILDRSIATLEGALRAAGDEDTEGSYARAQAAYQEAARRHKEVETDVRALALLDDAFTARSAAGQSELLLPIQARLAPYLRLVFPEGNLQFGNGLSPARLERGQRAEGHEQLSRGTREQIAVLVRLGLGRLLADQGASVPLLLDDALVYADDQRLLRMFDALALAAETSQIIVFTCRGQAFAPLARSPGAVDATLQPWNPDPSG